MSARPGHGPRVAVVGLGNAGFDLHLPALAAIGGVEIVGACDPDAARTRRAHERWNVPTFGSLDALLDRARPDVVIVATPPASHADLCVHCLGAGSHVICEKPFAPSIAEADRIIEAARATGRRVAVNHEFREMPIMRAVRDRIGAPGIGELVFAQVWQNMDLPPWEEPGWRGRLLKGVLFEAGIHLIDYALALFERRPVAVTATMSSCGSHADDSDAVALITLEFPGGRLAQIVQNRLCPGNTQYFEVRADTTAASLRASFGGRARLLAGLYRSTRPQVRFEYGRSGMAWLEDGARRRVIARNPRDPGMRATRLLLERTLRGFADGTAVPAGADDARDGLLVLAACYESARSGNRIPLDDTWAARCYASPIAAAAE